MADLIGFFNADSRSVSKFSGLMWFLVFEDLYNGEGGKAHDHDYCYNLSYVYVWLTVENYFQKIPPEKIYLLPPKNSKSASAPLANTEKFSASPLPLQKGRDTMTDNIKINRIPTKIKWKIHVLYTFYFNKFLKVLLINVCNINTATRSFISCCFYQFLHQEISFFTNF